MEDWVARFADADAGDSQATMGPNIASTERTYWTQLNAISRLPKDAGSGATDHRYPLPRETGSRGRLPCGNREGECCARCRQIPVGNHLVHACQRRRCAHLCAGRASQRAWRYGAGAIVDRNSRKTVGQASVRRAREVVLRHVTGIETKLLRLRIDLSYLPN